MVGSSVLLSRAGKEVQIADHLLSVTYPLAGEPKVLFSVVRHACRAVEAAAEALTGGSPSELWNSEIPSAAAAAAVYDRMKRALNQYDEAAVVFSRRQRFVMASDDFRDVRSLTADEMLRGMKVIKEFVYQAGRHLMVIRQ